MKKKPPIDRLVVLQRRANKLLASIDAHMSELGSTQSAAPAVPLEHETTLAPCEQFRSDLEKLRADVAALIMGQERTNELLELAFRAAFDREELRGR